MLILLPISTHEHQNHLCLTWKASVSINWERRFPRPASPRPWWTGSTHKRSRNCISIKFIPKSVFSNQFSPRVCTTWPQQNSGLLIGGCFGPPGAWRVTGGQRQVVPWEGSGLAVAASPKSFLPLWSPPGWWSSRAGRWITIGWFWRDWALYSDWALPS